MSLISFLFALQAFACPAGSPNGYTISPDAKERAYVNAEKTIQLVLKCDSKVKEGDVLAALKLLGQVHSEKSVSYVDVKDGALRIYVAGDAQLSVVAKTPEALAKASPALVDYLKK